MLSSVRFCQIPFFSLWSSSYLQQGHECCPVDFVQYNLVVPLWHCARHATSEVHSSQKLLALAAAYLSVFASWRTRFFLLSSLAWVLAAAGGSFVSCVGLCYVCVFLNLMLWFQPSGLPHCRERAFVILACSPLVYSDCFCCPWLALLVNLSLLCLAVLSALWLALIALLPNPSAFLAAFSVWGVLVDV